MNDDFAYAYWVDDVVDRKHIRGVAVGFTDLESGQTHDSVISIEAARRVAKQILAVVDEIGKR